MSKKFRDGIENTVTSEYIGEKSLIEISDFRLQKLITGVTQAITSKTEFVDSHTFPDKGNRYLDKLRDQLQKLRERLVELETEQERRK